MAHLNQKRYEEAIAEHREVLRLVPDNALSHGDLGRVYLETGMLDEAAEALDRALSIQPDLVPALIDRAILCVRTNNHEEAGRYLQRLESLGVDFRGLPAELRRFQESRAPSAD